jgi:hypothetical protein
MDARFAHRFAGGPPPVRPPRNGKDKTRYEWQEFRKALVAFAVSSLLLLGGYISWTAGNAGWRCWRGSRGSGLVVLIWLIWPVTATLWPGTTERK